MAEKQMVPVKRGDRSPAGLMGRPFFSLWDEVDRIFDDFARGLEIKPFRAFDEQLKVFSPALDVSEDEKEFTVKAELPGLDEKDIDLTITPEYLTLKGEKKEEKEEKKKDYYRVERSYGSFHRVVPLPRGIDTEKAGAEFKKGVLTVTLPKTKEAQAAGKKIPVKSGN